MMQPPRAESWNRKMTRLMCFWQLNAAESLLWILFDEKVTQTSWHQWTSDVSRVLMQDIPMTIFINNDFCSLNFNLCIIIMWSYITEIYGYKFQHGKDEIHSCLRYLIVFTSFHTIETWLPLWSNSCTRYWGGKLHLLQGQARIQDQDRNLRSHIDATILF